MPINTKKGEINLGTDWSLNKELSFRQIKLNLMGKSFGVLASNPWVYTPYKNRKGYMLGGLSGDHLFSEGRSAMACLQMVAAYLL